MQTIFPFWLCYGILASIIFHCFDGWSLEPAANDAYQTRVGDAMGESRRSEFAQLRNTSDNLNELPNDFIQERKRSVKSFFYSRTNGLESNDSGKPIENAPAFEVKRNVATLARLGRLNTIRYGHGQSRFAARKKTNSDEYGLKQNEHNTNAEQEMDTSDGLDCYQNDFAANTEVEPNFGNRKRYIAALARSGRLPVWHTLNRWDSAKRDDFPVSAHLRNYESELNNIIDRVSEKYKRCKKLNNYQTINQISPSLLNFSSEMKMRNIAAMIRDGKLFNSYRDSKRRMEEPQSDEDDFANEIDFQNRNLAALPLNRRLPFENSQASKRNIQAMARNGRLLFNSYSDHKRSKEEPKSEENDFENKSEFQKRYLAALARNGYLPFKNNPGNKRNIQAMARNGKLLFNSYSDQKRSKEESESDVDIHENVSEMEKVNLSELARNGKLPFKTSQSDKRNIQAMAQNGILQGNNPQNYKRNVQAMARNGKLLFNSYLDHKRSKEQTKSDVNTFYNGPEMEKRNLSALARNGKLLFKTAHGDKRNIQAMARNGYLQGNNLQYYIRNVQAMARNGNLLSNPYLDHKKSKEESKLDIDTFQNGSEMEKRNLAALARNGKLPFKTLQNEKRNIQAMARNGFLQGNNLQDYKRNVQVMARNGKLLSNSYLDHKGSKEESRSDVGTFENGSEIEKRNLAALARNGKLPFKTKDNKRNIQAMARNGILQGNSLQNYKRNVQAMARSGKLLFNSYLDRKRSKGDSKLDEDDFENPSELQKRNIGVFTRNGKLPLKNSQDSKRNVQAMARKGKLLFKNSSDFKRRKEDLNENVRE